MLPLEGITVVSLEQAVAAPFATRQLADLGARVIKVERPEVGDFARGYDRTVKGLASHFVWLNRSKESLTLDLKQDGPKRYWPALSKGPTSSSRISRRARPGGLASAHRSCGRGIRP
jgi:itaconate CoA-transferase